jgi:hypothetical protein
MIPPATNREQRTLPYPTKKAERLAMHRAPVTSRALKRHVRAQRRGSIGAVQRRIAWGTPGRAPSEYGVYVVECGRVHFMHDGGASELELGDVRR